MRRYQKAIERIGGAAELLRLPEGIRRILRETSDLEVKTKMLEAIAAAIEGRQR